MHQMQTRPVQDGSKAQRVYLLLRDEITNGARPPETPLPGELRLAEGYGVSRVTIRRALDALEDEGLVERRAGSGTVVRPAAAQRSEIAADFATLMPQIVRMGQDTTARLLAYSYIEPPLAIAEALRVGAGDKVQRAVRVRLIDGQPFSHLTTHVPEDVAQNYSEADLATTPLFMLLERSGAKVDRATQSISATLASPEVAEALDLAVGAALIALVRIVFDDSGRAVEHLSALYRPDRFRLEMSLDRVGEAGQRHWAPVLVHDVAAGAPR